MCGNDLGEIFLPLIQVVVLGNDGYLRTDGLAEKAQSRPILILGRRFLVRAAISNGGESHSGKLGANVEAAG
jgi:hypothetical protein